ncbi:MAG: hypothetical protein C4530_01755 [Desulfobacteraceae bacterium]|nr:MAG: hypothetical protein C4530_01755 [Desulfobacteraceae bacterium]
MSLHEFLLNGSNHSAGSRSDDPSENIRHPVGSMPDFSIFVIQNYAYGKEVVKKMKEGENT